MHRMLGYLLFSLRLLCSGKDRSARHPKGVRGMRKQSKTFWLVDVQEHWPPKDGGLNMEYEGDIPKGLVSGNLVKKVSLHLARTNLSFVLNLVMKNNVSLKAISVWLTCGLRFNRTHN